MQHAIVNIALKANIRLYHVPGHSGVFGNEVADFIAFRAARRGLSRTNNWSWRNVQSMFRAEMKKRWALSLENRDTELHKWVPDLWQLPSFFPPNKAFVTLLMGHGQFHPYFHRFNLMVEPRCFCGHYLTECPDTRYIAAQMSPKVIADGSNLPCILEQARNRALLICLVRHISEGIPELSW
ncbi:hypothetical protein MRX96_020749 [Rhipicephalus microplus]